MKKRKIILVSLSSACLLAACGASRPDAARVDSNKPLQERSGPKDLGKRPSLAKPVTLQKDFKTIPEGVNEFSKKTFVNLYNFEKDKEKSIIYSPYSYLSCLSLLNKYTDYEGENELSLYEGLDFKGYKVNNLESENLALVNKSLAGKGAKSDDELKFVSFPKEGEKASEELQKKVLKEVLSTPDYSDPKISAVLVNATRFLGYWSEAFDKDMTKKVDYSLLNGKKISVDMMNSSDLSKDNSFAYEDDNVQVYRKPLVEKEGVKDKTGYAYIIKPKNVVNNKKALDDFVKNIGTYVENYEDKAKSYSKVYVSMPKVNVESKFDLKAMEKASGSKFINDTYNLKKDYLKNNSVPVNIDSISQVAKLQVDEERVEAKAVTEIVALTSLAPERGPVFELRVDSPFFLVTTSMDKDGKELISFMSFINNPTQK